MCDDQQIVNNIWCYYFPFNRNCSIYQNTYSSKQWTNQPITTSNVSIISIFIFINIQSLVDRHFWCLVWSEVERHIDARTHTHTHTKAIAIAINKNSFLNRNVWNDRENVCATRNNLSISFVSFKLSSWTLIKADTEKSAFLFENITRTCGMIDMNRLEQLIIVSTDWNNGQNVEWQRNKNK